MRTWARASSAALFARACVQSTRFGELRRCGASALGLRATYSRFWNLHRRPHHGHRTLGNTDKSDLDTKTVTTTMRTINNMIETVSTSTIHVMVGITGVMNILSPYEYLH